LTIFSPATFLPLSLLTPCSLLALLWIKVLEDESVALTLTGL
jgi:hypothetical protein